MKLVLTYLILLIPAMTNAQQKTNFIEEFIDFELNNELFRINGIYVFSNSSDREVQNQIIFPFACITDSIEIVRVYNMSTGENVNYNFIDRGISFRIELNPSDTVSINIAYNQKLKKENIYILKSTASWKEPLKLAKYTLSVSGSVVVDSISYMPESVNNGLYLWTKKDFIPENDFIIWIK